MLPVQLKPNVQSSVFEIPSVQKKMLWQMGSKSTYLSPNEMLAGYFCIWKDPELLWTPHSCISMSLFSSMWNVCHFFYQHPNSVYWKGINNTYNQKQKLNHEKSLIIMFHIFLSRWDVFCRKMRSEGYDGHKVLIFGVMDKRAVCSLLI